MFIPESAYSSTELPSPTTTTRKTTTVFVAEVTCVMCSRLVGTAVRTAVEILRRPKSQHDYFAVSAPSIGSRINRAGVGRRRGWSHSEQPLACEEIRAPDGLRHVAVRVRCVCRTCAGEPEPGDEHTGSVGRRQIRCRSECQTGADL